MKAGQYLVSLAIVAVAMGAAMLADDGRAQDDSPQADPSRSIFTPVPRYAGSERAAFAYGGELTQGGWIRGRAPEGALSARLGEQELVLDANGDFFAAFDRDAGLQTELVARLPGGREVREPVAVNPRDWQIERVNIARSPGGASDDFMRIRTPELARINAAREADSPVDGWRQDFIWPVTGRISGRFGSQRIYRGGEAGSYHSGLDIAPGAGTPFVAPADGVVTLAAFDEFTLEGHLIIVDHGAGLNSAFLHASEILVEEGQVVHRGDVLGRVGASGRATGPHLHWSLKWRDARLDPLLFVGPMP